MARGGFRPTAPQNNPANINPMGGNGQSGRDYTGFAYGENKAINEQQASAPMAATPTPSFAPTNPVRNLPQATPLTAPTQRPDEPITAGVDFGPGPDSTVINLPNTQPTILNVIQTIAENDPSGDAELIFLALQNRG